MFDQETINKISLSSEEEEEVVVEDEQLQVNNDNSSDLIQIFTNNTKFNRLNNITIFFHFLVHSAKT